MRFVGIFYMLMHCGASQVMGWMWKLRPEIKREIKIHPLSRRLTNSDGTARDE